MQISRLFPFWADHMENQLYRFIGDFLIQKNAANFEFGEAATEYYRFVAIRVIKL